LSSTAPTPSPGRNPSPSPKLRLASPLPSRSICRKESNFEGSSVKFTPPATAIEQLPAFRLSQAVWIAVSALEHAVLIAMLGPVRLKKWDVRLASSQSVQLDRKAACSSEPSDRGYWWYIVPTKTPTPTGRSA